MPATIYDSGAYLAANEGWHSEDAEFKFAYVAALIDRHALSPRRVVDIGCGAGKGSRLIGGRYAAQVAGYDPSPQAIALAEATPHPANVSFVCGGLATAPCDFDLGVMLDVFEHVDDYIGFLREARRHARRWIFHIPLDLNAFSALRDGHMMSRAAFGHLHYFSETSALATLDYCGFTVRDVIHTPGFMQHFRTKRTLRSMPAFLPRVLLYYAISPRLCARLLGGVSLMVLAESQAGG